MPAKEGWVVEKNKKAHAEKRVLLISVQLALNAH